MVSNHFVCYLSGSPLSRRPINNETNEELAEQGVRMGIGTTIALAISYMAGFAKLGWAPSAVGNVVRYDRNYLNVRAWARFFGTIGGAFLALLP